MPNVRERPSPVLSAARVNHDFVPNVIKNGQIAPQRNVAFQDTFQSPGYG